MNRNPCIERSIEFAVKSSGLSGFSEVERRDWHWQCHCRHDRDSWPQIKQEQINFQRLHGVRGSNLFHLYSIQELNTRHGVLTADNPKHAAGGPPRVVEAVAVHLRRQIWNLCWQGSVCRDVRECSTWGINNTPRFGNRYFENRNGEEEVPGLSTRNIAL